MPCSLHHKIKLLPCTTCKTHILCYKCEQCCKECDLQNKK